MTEGREKSSEVKSTNPLLAFIDSNHHGGSVREIINSAMTKIDPWDLPEDSDELKKVLNEAVDYADSLTKAR